MAQYNGERAASIGIARRRSEEERAGALSSASDEDLGGDRARCASSSRTGARRAVVTAIAGATVLMSGCGQIPVSERPVNQTPVHLATIEFIDASCLAVDSTERDPDRSIGR